MQTATTVPAAPCRIVSIHRIPGGGDQQPPTYTITLVDTATGTAMCATLAHHDAVHLADVLTMATGALG